MKLYHGSPKKLKILKPIKAKGIMKFENQRAIFLVDKFKHAALYAIGKTLKGKTSFAVTKNRLIITGNKVPKEEGYVYEVQVEAKKTLTNQFIYKKPIKKFKIHKVNLKDYVKDIIYVKNEEELFRVLKLRSGT